VIPWAALRVAFFAAAWPVAGSQAALPVLGLPMRLSDSVLGALLTAIVLLAGPAAAAAAADAEDCAGNTPAVSIPACTRIITQARAASGQVAEAFANRGKAVCTENLIRRRAPFFA
jgi:hypothetical protein